MDDYLDEVWRTTHTVTGEYEVDTGSHRPGDGSVRTGENRDWTARATDRSMTRLEDRVPGEPDRVRGDWR